MMVKDCRKKLGWLRNLSKTRDEGWKNKGIKAIEIKLIRRSFAGWW